MTRLFVGNLPPEARADDLRTLFATYGPVSFASVVMDRSTGESKGFGFVEMAAPAHAVAALRGLNGTELKGSSITVSPARARGENGSNENSQRGWAVIGDGRNRW